MTIVLSVCCLGVVSCYHDDDIIIIDNPRHSLVPEDKGGRYSELKVPVVRYNAPTEEVTLRFYDDLPSVAYIAVSDFHRLMLPNQNKMRIRKQGGVYFLQNSEGQARVNVFDDTFTSDDYTAFTNMMSKNQKGMPNVYYDGVPFVRFKAQHVSPQTVPVEFDFKRYGIDLHGDDKDVYFPLATLSDLYSDLHYNIAGFNGEKVVVNDDPNQGTMSAVDSTFAIPVYRKETTTDDMALFRYNELCFAIDHFYGMAGRSEYEQAVKHRGVEAMLDAQGITGQQTKQLLKSKNTAEFVLGMDALQYYLADGGHTAVGLSENIPESIKGEFITRYETAQSTYPLATEAARKSEEQTDAIIMIARNLDAQRKEQLGKDKYYKMGNTAFCVFNYFLYGENEWMDYYAGGKKPTLEDYPENESLILLDALEKANNDPEVKNFVIDISTNGGGSVDIDMMITSLLANSSVLYTENTMTRQRAKTTYVVDRNFDGKFDERDRDVRYDLNVAVLTSGFSFSCGNLLPAQMKDLGLLVIGERSGGGSCAIQQMVTADGFDYRISSFRARLADKNWDNIDGGIEPSITIEHSKFYDIEYLGKLMEEWYAKRQGGSSH